MEDEEDAYGSTKTMKTLSRTIFLEKQISDTLIVTTLIELNACGKTIFIFKNKTNCRRNLCLDNV
jgi:hypothetical protein